MSCMQWQLLNLVYMNLRDCIQDAGGSIEAVAPWSMQIDHNR